MSGKIKRLKEEISVLKEKILFIYIMVLKLAGNNEFLTF